MLQTLTIEPGVVVKEQSHTELKVLGHLEAVGTATEPSAFTSSVDSGPRGIGDLLIKGERVCVLLGGVRIVGARA